MGAVVFFIVLVAIFAVVANAGTVENTRKASQSHAQQQRRQADDHHFLKRN